MRTEKRRPLIPLGQSLDEWLHQEYAIVTERLPWWEVEITSGGLYIVPREELPNITGLVVPCAAYDTQHWRVLFCRCWDCTDFWYVRQVDMHEIGHGVGGHYFGDWSERFAERYTLDHWPPEWPYSWQPNTGFGARIPTAIQRAAGLTHGCATRPPTKGRA